jgi:CRP/FNR family cyclic AMP-dependent transcriptional regulator
MTALVSSSIRQRQKINALSSLSESDIFCDLSPEEVDQMANMATVTTYSRGQVFYTPDQAGEVLFLLKHGKAQLYRVSPDGEKQVVATLEAGTVFGEMSLLAQGMYGVSAEALEDCRVWVMSRADLERMLTSHPKFALRVVETLAIRLKEAVARLEDITFKKIPARLASVLLRLNQEASQKGEIVGYTHQDLAEMIGTYRETTTQTLSAFRRQGLVKVRRKRVQLLDVEGLKQIAEG